MFLSWLIISRFQQNLQGLCDTWAWFQVDLSQRVSEIAAI